MAGGDDHRGAADDRGGRGGLHADAARPAQPEHRVGAPPQRRGQAPLLQELARSCSRYALFFKLIDSLTGALLPLLSQEQPREPSVRKLFRTCVYGTGEVGH